MCGGDPVLILKLSRTLKKKGFLAAMPDQFVQRSCSIEKDNNVGRRSTAFEGGTTVMSM
jgi:hypothetical protein